MTAARMRLLLATLWVGSLWTVGYVVAPTLFATLADRALAGTIAGSMFRVEAWISLVCGLALFLWLLIDRRSGDVGQRRRTIALIAAMLACTLIGHFGLQPFMAALREAAGTAGMTAEAASRFAMLHGIASVIYLLQSVLGIGLMLKLR